MRRLSTCFLEYCCWYISVYRKIFRNGYKKCCFTHCRARSQNYQNVITVYDIFQYKIFKVICHTDSIVCWVKKLKATYAESLHRSQLFFKNAKIYLIVFIGSPQYSFLLHFLNSILHHTLSNSSIAASTIDGSSVSMPASKFRRLGAFMPMPAPARFALPI